MRRKCIRLEKMCEWGDLESGCRCWIQVSDTCCVKQEPVFVTKNGYGDLVVFRKIRLYPDEGRVFFLCSFLGSKGKMTDFCLVAGKTYQEADSR